MKSFETIVIGLGAMGSAAVYQLAKKGNKVLGIDQFSPPHTLGSTHGDTRIIRQAIGEGDEYVPLVLRSYAIFQEIEKITGKKLLTPTGALIMPNPHSTHHGSKDFLGQTIAAAQKYNIAYKMLDAKQIRKQFPQFNVKDDVIGYFEEKAGFLKPELCVSTQIELAKHFEAEIHDNEKFVSFTVLDSGEVLVKTTKDEYLTKKMILSAGAWIAKILGKEYEQVFKVYRQVLYWFAISGDNTPFLPENFPVFMYEFGKKPEDYIYGFPAVDGAEGGIKVASEQFNKISDPDSLDREVSQEEINNMYKTHIAIVLPVVSNRCIKAKACLYTVTPDSKFIIDFHPKFSQIIIASPCSGHGFKHSAAIGEVLAKLAIDGKSKIDISKFNFKRFMS